jgi:hypothetical protein
MTIPIYILFSVRKAIVSDLWVEVYIRAQRPKHPMALAINQKPASKVPLAPAFKPMSNILMP